MTVATVQRTRFVLTLIGVSALVGAVIPSGANALTVAIKSTSTRLVYCEEKGGCAFEAHVSLVITDPAGEDNDVTIETPAPAAFVPINSLVVTDASGPVSVGDGCESVAGGAARCPVPVVGDGRASLVYAMTKGSVFDLGSGNDTLRMVGYDVFCGDVLGGPGNDTLTGTGASLNHGYNPGCALTWDGGAGADRLNAAGATVTYAGRTTPVTVTLGDGANDGEVGEGDDVGGDVPVVVGGAGGDRLSGGRALDGGPGNDRLTAAAGGSTLLGGAGDDSLVGGAGNDVLDGGTGDDVLDGGAGADSLIWSGAVHANGGIGDDRLRLGTGDGQTINGGSGQDTLLEPLKTGSRPTPARRISLDGRANDGLPGQHNNVSRVERVHLGRGTLVGSSANEQLTVDNGSVFGRGGDDVVIGSLIVDGGNGSDTLFGTSHGAVFRAADHETDTLVCPGKTVFAVRAIIRDRQDTLTHCFVRKAR